MLLMIVLKISAMFLILEMMSGEVSLAFCIFKWDWMWMLQIGVIISIFFLDCLIYLLFLGCIFISRS